MAAVFLNRTFGGSWSKERRMKQNSKRTAKILRADRSGLKKSTLHQLTNRQLQLILTYAPAGLGHLRIMDSLYHGLPATVNPVVLGSEDKSIQTMHRLTSINPIGSAIFDWLQTGPLAPLANSLYRLSLRWDTRVVYQELSRLIDERLDPPKKILVVATHFGLAHKLAVIKKKLEREKQVRIVLVVFVSDDTFQQIWYVDGADLLAVTSEFIRKKYAAYGKLVGKPLRIEVVSYPMNPDLEKPLDPRSRKEKTLQLDASSRVPIRVSIPISGAAVGMDYYSTLITGLHEKSGRFRFYIVSKDAPFTRKFLSQWEGKPWVSLHVGRKDREVVDLYDVLLKTQVISIEVTKPSEHAFKALLGTQSRGGVILLFTRPKGGQEFDNLDFLSRHTLLPSRPTNAQLYELSEDGISMAPVLRSRLVDASRTWRAVRIPEDPAKAVDFIWWLHRSGILLRMMDGNKKLEVRDEGEDVLGSKGVEEFWDLATSV
jgi:hypothetical protein